MAKVANVNTRLYLDQYDVSGFLNAGAFDLRQELIVVTTFSDTGPRRLVGNYDHKHDWSGFFDGTDDQIDEIVHALVENNSDHYLAALWGANVENSIAYESLVTLSGKPLSGALGGAVLLNHAYEGRGGLYRGLVLRNATVTGTGAGTGRNMGATSANTTFAVVYRVISGTFTSITIGIDESQNDGGADPYAAIAALASGAITTPSVVYKSTTGATEAWKRANVTAFTGTNAVILVTAGTIQGT